jgi:hypothetical protein
MEILVRVETLVRRRHTGRVGEGWPIWDHTRRGSLSVTSEHWMNPSGAQFSPLGSRTSFDEVFLGNPLIGAGLSKAGRDLGNQRSGLAVPRRR